MPNRSIRTTASRLSLLLVSLAIPVTASAGKDLPKDLASYFEGKSDIAPGVIEAVEEHFLTSDYGQGISCTKAWSKSAKQMDDVEKLFKAYAAGGDCLKEPLREYLRERALAIAEAHPGSENCGADYPPSAISAPDGSRPESPSEAAAWAHEPAAALAASIESSAASAKESWSTCVAAVNGARDAYAPLFTWLEENGAVNDNIVRDDPEWPGGCSQRLPGDIGSDEQTSEQIAAAAELLRMGTVSMFVSELSDSAVPLCHFGSQSVSLAQEYRAAAELNEELQKRVEEVDAAVAAALENLVRKCPTKDDEHYEEVTNAATVWDDDNIGPAVSWAEEVVGGKGGRSGAVTGACVSLGAYAGAVPDPLSELVTPHSAAIEAAAALAEEIAEVLPGLQEKKEEIEEAAAAERDAENATYDAMYSRCETLGDQAEARELDWKKCMSNADLTMTARQYAITDDELYHDHMEKQAVACAHGTGLAGALQVFLTQCQDEPDCNSEHLYEIDPYEGDVDDLHSCPLTFPDYAGDY